MTRIVSAGRMLPAALIVCALTLSIALPGGIVTGATSQGTPAATNDGDDPCAAIVASGTPTVEHAGHADGDDPAPTEQTGEPGNPADYAFDLVFVDAMIAHDQAAILAAEIALVRAEHEALREFASAIVATREAEIAVLRDWRNAWYGDAGPVPRNVATGLMDEGLMLVGGPADAGAGMGGPAGPVGATYDAYLLCTAIGSFDLTFLAQMIPHHQGAVGMALLARERAEHAEVRALAGEIVAARQAEIAQMTEWQVAWAAEAGGTPAATDDARTLANA